MKKDNYILILGNIVTKRLEQDGMNQRIVAIDEILSKYKKIYIENIKKPQTGWFKYILRCTINVLHKLQKQPRRFYSGNVNSYKMVRMSKLEKLLENASCIYIHSIYSAMKLPLECLLKHKNKIIIDAHGCAIEEMEYAQTDKKQLQKAVMYEEELFNSVKAIVCVTENMISLYRTKYPSTKAEFILLPIFKTNETACIEKKAISCLRVVYSGGTNKWQNIDEMVDVIRKLPDKFEVNILSKDVKIFEEKLDGAKNIGKITIKSVSPQEIGKEYENADFGFILRSDIIVNKVACPTKLIEYIAYGLIPIVDFPNIGDFENLGYQYINKNDLLNGIVPSASQAALMREKNYEILQKLRIDSQKAIVLLNETVKKISENS